MEAMYEIWDTEKNRRVNTFSTMTQALALCAATMNRLGEAGIEAWALVRSSSSSEDRNVMASGKALAKIVREDARRRNS